MKKYLIGAITGSVVLASGGPMAAFANDIERRDFAYLDQMNRASAIVLHENNVINDIETKAIADAIDRVFLQLKGTEIRRGGYYLGLEPKYIAAGGDAVSKLHVGRSTIDMSATRERMIYRDGLLDLYGKLIEARRSMLDFAAKHAEAIIPAYTLNVQAQPTSLGHYITGYTSVLDRHATLLEETYKNVNTSPMGVAALGTSSYPIDRKRLAQLLGFDGTIRNSFDAALIGNAETSMRVVGVVNAIAVTSSQLLSDLETQYHQVKPWITFPPELTSGSSIMPQKLNPTGVNNAQRKASEALGYASLYTSYVHRTGSGDVFDSPEGAQKALSTLVPVMVSFKEMFAAFKFDEQRALDEVLGDYAVATEFANELQRRSGIPFRTAHHIAGMLVKFGREQGLRPVEIKYADFVKLYRQASVEHSLPPLEPEFSEEVFGRLMRPENMVNSSKGFGGPQRDEVSAMLADGYARLTQDEKWLTETRNRLLTANNELTAAFESLRAINPN